MTDTVIEGKKDAPDPATDSNTDSPIVPSAADEDPKVEPVPPLSDKQKANPIEVFCKRSGYEPSDVDGYNVKTRVFVTTNGGKYQLGVKSGVRRLQGPPYPKEVPEA